MLDKVYSVSNKTGIISLHSTLDGAKESLKNYCDAHGLEIFHYTDTYGTEYIRAEDYKVNITKHPCYK